MTGQLRDCCLRSSYDFPQSPEHSSPTKYARVSRCSHGDVVMLFCPSFTQSERFLQTDQLIIRLQVVVVTNFIRMLMRNVFVNVFKSDAVVWWAAIFCREGEGREREGEREGERERERERRRERHSFMGIAPRVKHPPTRQLSQRERTNTTQPSHPHESQDSIPDLQLASTRSCRERPKASQERRVKHPGTRQRNRTPSSSADVPSSIPDKDR